MYKLLSMEGSKVKKKLRGNRRCDSMLRNLEYHVSSHVNKKEY